MTVLQQAIQLRFYVQTQPFQKCYLNLFQSHLIYFQSLGSLIQSEGDCEHEELTLTTTIKQVSFEVPVMYFEKGTKNNIR